MEKIISSVKNSPVMLCSEFIEKKRPDGIHIVVEERGGVVEAIHRSHIAVVNSKGDLLMSSGDPDHITFTRSCIKPIQALSVLHQGAAERFGLSDVEIAIICGSHSGEKEHIAIIEKMMEKIGITSDKLKCAGHAPFHKKTAKDLNGIFTKLHDNCSGKHVGALALCKHMGWNMDDYLDFDHPLNRKIVRTLANIAKMDERDIHLGKDGCGIPNYAIPISKMAYLFAKLGNPSDSKWEKDMKRIGNIFLSHPHLIAGTDRFDTVMMKDNHDILISKAGAAGLQTMAVKTEKEWLGISIKIEDGSYPAVETLSCHILDEIGVELGDECIKMYYPKIVKTRSGKDTGSVFSVGHLKYS